MKVDRLTDKAGSLLNIIPSPRCSMEPTYPPNTYVVTQEIPHYQDEIKKRRPFQVTTQGVSW